MCGFVLAFNDADFDVELHSKSILHRGPNSTKYYEDATIKCGFNRLSIVDPGQQSDQPMFDSARRWLLLFNGEIYNYRELRGELEARYGYEFKTDSDSEVLLVGLGYERRRFVAKLNGIFAFVFVDLRDYSLLAGRDPFGVKPLYFTRKQSSYYFCSESKPLASLTSAEIDRKSLALLLSSGSTLNGKSIYRDVFLVQPNSVIQVKEGKIEEYEARSMCLSESEEVIPQKRVIEQIVAAVERHCPEIGFGLQLSGGIDSTLLLSMLYKSERLTGTYAVNVDDTEMSEKYWQDMALARFNTDKQARVVNLGPADFQIKKLRGLMVSADVPFFHPSYVGATRMAKQAFDYGLKVLMSGEGADEIFIGYRWFFNDETAESIFEYTPLDKLCQFLGVDKPDTSFLNEINRLEFFQKYYLQRWLARSDLTGMLNSVEIRVPFLDLELVDMANRLKMVYKAKHGAKWMMKDHLSKMLPGEFVNRRKRGFDFPLNSWMQDDQISFLKINKDLFEIDNEAIMQLNRSNDYRDKRLIFSLCSFALWSGR